MSAARESEGRQRPSKPSPLSPFLLEYLDVVHRLELEHVPASPLQVAKRLGIGKDESTERLFALQGLGLLQTAASGRIVLTPAGERVAVGLIRKHRLLERFLSDLLKLPWERVHEDASRLTSVLSDPAAEALAQLLGHPPDCPHGNPIPALDGPLPADGGTPLHRLKHGQSGTILRIEKEEEEILKYLADLGMLPQTELEVEEVAPFGGPILVRVGSSRYALGRKVAARIFVRPR